MNAPLILNDAVRPMPRRNRKKKATPVVVPEYPKKVRVIYPKSFKVPVIWQEEKTFIGTLSENLSEASKKLFQKVKMDIAKASIPSGAELMAKTTAVAGKVKSRLPQYRPVVKHKPQYAMIRIIPHHSISNNNARRLQSALYELFSVNRPFLSKICGLFNDDPPILTREGLHIAMKPAPDFWWITRLAADDEGKKIEYYCAMPAEYVESFKTKFRNHEQWRKSTIEDVVEPFEIPEEDTDLYALKYKRHDIFSLDFDYSEQTLPTRDLLGITNELSDGESVQVFIKSMPLSRGKWKKLSDYAWDIWNKGGVPYRAGVDPLRLLRNAGYAIAYAISGIKTVLDDILKGFEKVFFHNRGTETVIAAEKLKFHNPDRETLLINGRLSNETNNKRNLPVLKTWFRYTVTSKDQVKREMLSRSVANAISNTSETHRQRDNTLEAVKVKIRVKQELNDLRNWKINDRHPNLMSVDELGKLEQLPTAALQEEYADALESNQRVEIELPEVFLDESGILAGTATDRGETHNIHVPTNNPNRLYTPRGFNGSPRMGKDQAIINFIVEAHRKHGIGAVIPDFIDEQGKDAKGNWKGMANAIRDHIEPDNIVDLDFSNTAYSFYLGLQMIFRNVEDPRIAADLVSEYLSEFLLSDGDEDKFQTQEFCREAAKATMGDLEDMKRMFKNQKFRQTKIGELDDVLDMDVWRDYDSLTERGGMMSGRQGQLAAPVIRRIDMLANREYSKPMFCQTSPNPAADLYKWVEQGKIVIMRIKMPNGAAMPEPVKKIFAYWIVMLTFLIKLSLDSKGAGTYLVLNEPHQYLSSGLVHFLERILSEAPKYKLAPIFAFHHFAQFKKFPGFVDILMSSSINWHIFKNTNIDVYKRMMPYLEGTFFEPQQAFEATKAYQYISVWLDENAEYAPPFICDALPLVGDRYKTLDNSFLTKRHIQMYGRPTKEVLDEIKAKNRSTKEEAK